MFVQINNPAEKQKAVITDITGKTMITEQLHAGKNNVAIAALEPGIYFLKIFNDDKQAEVHKFIKQ